MPRQNKEMVASHRAHSLIFALGNNVSAAAMVAGQIRATPYPPKSGAHLKAEKKHRAASNEREALSDRDRDLRRELSADLKNVRAFSYTTTQMQLQRDIDELATRLVAAENAWRGAHAELFQHAERYRRTLQIHANEMHDSSLCAMSDVFDLVATVTRPLLTLSHVWEQQAGNVNGTFFYPPSDPRVAFAPYIARALIDLADVFCVARPDLTPDDPPITLPAMPDSLVVLKAVKDQGRLDAERRGVMRPSLFMTIMTAKTILPYKLRRPEKQSSPRPATVRPRLITLPPVHTVTPWERF